jgi:hypothetical protein
MKRKDLKFKEKFIINWIKRKLRRNEMKRYSFIKGLRKGKNGTILTVIAFIIVVIFTQDTHISEETILEVNEVLFSEGGFVALVVGALEMIRNFIKIIKENKKK